MKTVKEIPANTIVEMTPELYQEFAQGGCVPACHLTHKWINIGDKFHLSSIDKKQIEDPDNENPAIHSKIVDVMLAEKSTVEKYIEYQQRLERESINRILQNRKEAIAAGRTGCFRINGEIVP